MNQETKKKIQILNSKFVNNFYLELRDKFYFENNVEKLKRQYLDVLKGLIDWNNIDRQDCVLLNFQKWSDEDEQLKNLFLIPYYLHSIIPEGLKVWSIDGEETQWNKQKDTDTRFGMLAYGIMVEESKCQ